MDKRPLTIVRRGVVRAGVVAGPAAIAAVQSWRSGQGWHGLVPRVPSAQAGVPSPLSLGVLARQDKATLIPTEPFQVPLPIPPILEPVRSDETTDFYELTVQERRVHIPGLPDGLTTTIWGFNGLYPGPTIKARGTLGQSSGRNLLGRPAVVRVRNGVRGSVTIHRHGGHQFPIDDGHPLDLVPPGAFKDYHYPNDQEGATLWYHDHSIDITGQQIYAGVAGFFLLEDDVERDLKARRLLPDDAHDIPIVIQDRQFGDDGRFNYPIQVSKVQFDGLMGDKMLVNGAVQPFLPVATRLYRFRILNGSNAREYRLALSNGQPLIQIGSDDALLRRPVPLSEIRISPAERVEVLVDFSALPVGSSVVLLNLGGDSKNLRLDRPVGEVLPEDAPPELLRFDVVRRERDDVSLPDALRPPSSVELLRESDALRERTWEFNRSDGQWTINGRLYDPDRIDATMRVGDVEIWRLVNKAGGWVHPVHVHMVSFQVLQRFGHDGPPPNAENGLKDTFLLRENETVRIISRFDGRGVVPVFSPGPGHPIFERTFVFHCHNAEHEDHAMMKQFETRLDLQAQVQMRMAMAQVEVLP